VTGSRFRGGRLVRNGLKCHNPTLGTKLLNLDGQQTLMDDLQAWYDLAVEQHQAGELEVAESLYRKILQENPGHLDATYLLGTLLLQREQFARAVELLEPLTKIRDDIADLHNNLGIAYNGLGRQADAARAFQQAIRARPDYAKAHFNLASLLEQRGNYTQAEHCYRQAIDINPDDAQAHFNLGHLLKLQRRWDDAEDCYVRLRAFRPDDLDVLVNLGFVLVKQEKLTEAIAIFREVLRLQPDYAQVHNNLSYIFERQGKLREAEVAARRALELMPDYPEGYNNLGTALRSMHRLDEASEAFRRAVELRGRFPLAEFNYGTTRLLAGDWPAGWAGYEQRLKTLDEPPRHFDAPQWKGEPLPGRKLLIYAEQGFGDTLQFVRYLPLVQQTAQARIILECQPELRSLLDGFPGIDRLAGAGEADAECDAQCPLGSLPAIFQTRLDSIPGRSPYLHANPDLMARWGAEVEQVAGGNYRVGIVWQGNPAQARDIIRSCQLEDFAPLSEIPGVTLISLQKGANIADLLARLPAGMRVVDLGSRFNDFADAAAVVAQLDLVISVDTAMAHLAGALGRPVWTLLAHAADWRWLTNRSDSPWYLTMRLFRQPAWGDWRGLFAEVANALQQRVQTR